MVVAAESDLILLFKAHVQKAERERKAQDAFNEARLQLTEARTGGATPARVSLLERRVKDAWDDLEVARIIADVSRKVAKDVLYPEGPKLVQQESAA